MIEILLVISCDLRFDHSFTLGIFQHLIFFALADCQRPDLGVSSVRSISERLHGDAST